MNKKIFITAASISAMALGAFVFANNGNPQLFSLQSAENPFTLTVTAGDVTPISGSLSTVSTKQGSKIPFGHTNISIIDGKIVLTDGTLFNHDDATINAEGGALSGMTSITINLADDVAGQALDLTYAWVDNDFKAETFTVQDNIAIDLSEINPNYFHLQGTATIESITATYTCVRGEEVIDNTMRVYLKANWSTANCYVWPTVGDPLAAWPGSAMTKDDRGLWYFDYDTTLYNNVIFTDGAEQTADLDSPISDTADCYNFAVGAWMDDEEALEEVGTAKVYVVLNWDSITDVKMNGLAMTKITGDSKGNYVIDIEAGSTSAAFTFKQSGATWHPTDKYTDVDNRDWSTSSRLDFKTALVAGEEYQITDISWQYEYDNYAHKWFSYTVNTL